MMQLLSHNKVFVKQIHEVAELLGFETRNKYQISDENQRVLGYAAEQQKGFLGFVLRQFLGHWRTFEIHIFNANREKVMTARQPFRFFFQRLEVLGGSGQPIGAIQQRFAFLTKKFDVLSEQGQVVFQVASPLFNLWTFKFKRRGETMALVQKKVERSSLRSFY